ncbi:hypothetical protein JAAARDRAFT_30824 [Jaapia argillacea MUCL 33604]|uniref:Uncharacterized protein n=1 Tax=Jaapia argillacea MUCL 33604 TaxID=933084 RepID=A0A067Q5H6_9AGAM|nr:hypothetical protein JAAARDRAFT_30824 [Jaapia argillacea MUCL 33604]
MRVLEEPFPAFTLVVTQAQNMRDVAPDRRSYNHTYARSSPTRPVDPLTMTVDYPYDDPMFFPTLTWPEIAPEVADNTDAVNLQVALDSLAAEEGTRPPSRHSRKRFSTLVVDLALTIKRKCQGVLTGSSRPPKASPSLSSVDKLA